VVPRVCLTHTFRGSRSSGFVPVVAARNLHKAYGAHVVLRDAELTLRTGERVGVVGRNGAGKSTLARILAGVEPPDGGSVSRRRGASVIYLDQVPRFDGDPTAEEAVLSGLEAWSRAVERHAAASRALESGSGDVEELLREQASAAEDVERSGGFEQGHRVASMLGHLGITRTDARVSTLSGGEQRRVALARTLIARPTLAVLDEPTNHLDADTIEWLESYLLDEYSGALLLITHDRYLLDRVAERTVEVAGGEVYVYDGGYELYLEQKAERIAHAARVEQNRQNFLRRELDWLRRQPKARSTKQKARIERAEAAMAVRGPRAERTQSFDLDLVKSGKTILEAKNLGVEMAGRRLVSGFDLFVTEGERIGIVGPNGAGKTTLIRTLLGELPPAEGDVTLGRNTRALYLDQLRSGLEDDKSVFDNVVGDQSRIDLGGQVVEPRSYLERFGFDGIRQRQLVGSLSGGERARVAVARLLRQSANLLVLDEPTNDFDVETLGALETMLLELGATALVVTHDRWFLDRVATSVLAFEADGRVIRYPGNYDTYRRLRAEADRLRAEEQPRAEEPRRAEQRRSTPPVKKKLTFAEERELTGLPDLIESAEQNVGALTEQLADPATYSAGGSDVADLTRRLSEARAEVERLMARWMALEEKQQG